jgi:PAS domain-containing protein
MTDRAPVGLCLFRHDGTPLTANAPFARMLGYDSPSELQRIAAVLGVFATTEEQARVLRSASSDPSAPGAIFRAKDGTQRLLRVMIADCAEHDSVALVVFDGSHPFPTQPA